MTHATLTAPIARAGQEQLMHDLYAARNPFALPELPPAPARHGLWMRRFNRLYAWGIAATVAAIIVPQYLYLVTIYLHGPALCITHTVIPTMFAAGSVVSLGLLVTAPIRVVTYLRERAARLNTQGEE